MTPNYTPAQLAAIANQPGYGVEEGYTAGPTPSGNGRQPTQTELLFEQEYLERRLEAGLIVFWQREPKIRMRGQTYTPDYMELLVTNGEVRFYEVKGSFRLGSESRSSVKARWTAAEFGNDSIRFFWARRLDSGVWRMREVKAKRERAR